MQAKKEGLVDEFRHSKHIDITENKTKTFNINKTIHYMKAKHTFNSKNECAKANLDKTKTTEWKKVGKAQKNDQDGLMGKPANRNKTNKTNKCNNPNEQKAPARIF